MSQENFLQEFKKLEIQAYKKSHSPGELRATHVPFSGSPLKHPHDTDKIILVADPYSTHTFYYEFKIKDVSYVEELPSLVNMDGETVNMARIWVKKGSVGLRCSPFRVEDLGTMTR